MEYITSMFNHMAILQNKKVHSKDIQKMFLSQCGQSTSVCEKVQHRSDSNES